MHGDLRRHRQQRLRIVEDDLHAGRDQLVGETLRGLGGDGQDADDDVLVLDQTTQLAGVADTVAADLGADLGRVDVEDRHDAEAVVGEDVRGGDRLAQVARA